MANRSVAVAVAVVIAGALALLLFARRAGSPVDDRPPPHIAPHIGWNDAAVGAQQQQPDLAQRVAVPCRNPKLLIGPILAALGASGSKASRAGSEVLRCVPGFFPDAGWAVVALVDDQAEQLVLDARTAAIVARAEPRLALDTRLVRL